MSPRAATPASLPLRFKLLLLVAGPLLVALLVAVGLPERLLGAGSALPLDDRARDLSGEFQELLAEARSAAQTALEAYPDVVSSPSPHGMAGRLEGIGVLDSRLRFLEWQDSPATPPPNFADADGPDWWIVEQGVRTRVFARAGPDANAQIALASYVIDSSLGDYRFADLFRRVSLDGIQLEVRFEESAPDLPAPTLPTQPATPPNDAEPEAMSLLQSPDGRVLGSVTLRAVSAESRQRIQRAAGQAWAVVLLVILAILLFDWPGIARRRGGLLVATGLVVLARVAFVLAEVPSRLLPRELGTASIYGSARPWQLLASPADLLLTAVALYLLCRGLQAWHQTLATRHPRVGLALVSVAALFATVIGIAVAVSLAFNSRGLSLDRPALWPPDARALLTLGLVLVLLGAAELWSTVGSATRSLLRGTRARTKWIGVAVPLVVLIVACSLVLQHLEDRLRVDRLSSELAPQILEQSDRRVVALRAALRGVQESFDGAQSDSPLLHSRPAFLAYRLWVAGELFHGGYKSSLDFYTLTGQRISHFGVDLPRLEEQLDAPLDGGRELTVRREAFSPAAAVQQELLHAELPITREDGVIGLAVGHVLDEPYNLPFLAWSAPFLTALGPGYSHVAGRDQARGPHYVLYDATGAVLFSTLRQPPPFDTALAAEGREHPLLVRSGDELFNGLSLREGRRFHLLLDPRRTLLERLSGVVRMGLLGLIVLALFELLPRLLRRGGPRSLIQALRGSFRRKLLVSVLVASVVPLLGLSLFLRGYIESRGADAVVTSAGQIVRTAQRVLEDYAASLDSSADDAKPFNDDILYWLRRVVGQEIHVYQDGSLVASSKRELFASGLLTDRLSGGIHRELGLGGSPYLVVPTMIGPTRIPVAYAPVRSGAIVDLVVAVPIVFEHRQITRATDRVAEMILLATVLVLSLLACAAAILARTVARPLKELVGATARIANGDYATRLVERTEDEVAELVRGFNSMASSLARQRSDLERRRDYMEALLRHATTGVISTDPEGRIVTLNPATRALLTPRVRDLREGVSLHEALAADAQLQPLSAALDGLSVRPGEPAEVDLELAGKPRRFRIVRVELPDPAGGNVGSLILLDDVTELMRSNQLAAWAEMARAIAHEIKNPLTPIQLSTEHLRRLLNDRGVLPSPEIEGCLETVIKQVRNLYDIAGEFSAYAKLPDLKPEPLDPVEFMRATIGPYRASGLTHVELDERYEASGTVAIDPKVLGRAVVNLVENALEAMPDGGRLTISVGPDEARGEVVLAVGDTGIGLDPEVRRRLFEPYFSTKSSGTGLGLAIVRRAVEAHHGRIELNTAVAGGTTFEIRLSRTSAS